MHWHHMRAWLFKNARIYAHVSPCEKCVKNALKIQINSKEKNQKNPKKPKKNRHKTIETHDASKSACRDNQTRSKTCKKHTCSMFETFSATIWVYFAIYCPSAFIRILCAFLVVS
jgi:hypothetical protein